MKRKIAMAIGTVSLSFVAAVSVAGFSIAGSGTEAKYYGKCAIITAFDYESDVVTVEDAEGFSWEFYGASDYLMGDMVAMIMSNNGTPDTILDDEIMSARYSGYTSIDVLGDIVDWEFTEDGLLLIFSDESGYFVER